MCHEFKQIPYAHDQCDVQVAAAFVTVKAATATAKRTKTIEKSGEKVSEKFGEILHPIMYLYRLNDLASRASSILPMNRYHT